MSNLEHLVENGLSLIEHGTKYEEWREKMDEDINWIGNENITINDLWEICQYVYYCWMPCRQVENYEE